MEERKVIIMEKINFENLPSTNTPINATNLNQLQTNVENAIGDLIKYQDFTSESFAVTSGTSYQGSIQVIVPDGYEYLTHSFYNGAYGNVNMPTSNYYRHTNELYYNLTANWGVENFELKFRVVFIKK